VERASDGRTVIDRSTVTAGGEILELLHGCGFVQVTTTSLDGAVYFGSCNHLTERDYRPTANHLSV